MRYNYYQRNEDDISIQEVKWINENSEKISEDESILFVFQVKNEVLLVTNKNIYFPQRHTKRNLSYNEIKNIKFAENSLLELITIEEEIYSIVFVTPVDKVKFCRVMNLLKNNFDKNIVTTFEAIDEEFNEFKILKYPPNQSQHKIPQVYLKQFGYLKDKQWMVTVMLKGEKFTRQKSIGSFTAETNVFDIESEDDRFPRMFETMNAELENLYPELIEDISNSDILSDKSWEILVQLVPNLIVRSDYWRDFVREILNSKNKNSFMEITVSVLAKSYDEFQELKKEHFYRDLVDGDNTSSKLNKTLILFLNYFLYHLYNFDVVIIKAQKGREFLTSDNPVNFISNQKDGKKGLFSENTELYFPLSNKYLAYFHHNSSTNDFPKLRNLKSRNIYDALDILTEDEYDKLIREDIIDAFNNLIIFPMELKYPQKKINDHQS